MDISVLYNLRAEISLLVAIIVVLVADIAIKLYGGNLLAECTILRLSHR